MLSELGLQALFSHAGSSDEWGRTAEQLANGPTYWRRCKVVFMMRDPRDTAVSAYYHARFRSRRFDGSLSTFLRERRFGLEKVVAFHLMWLDARDEFPRFEVLQYEMLQQRPAQELRRVAAFLAGQSFVYRDVQRALEVGSFSSMHDLEVSGEGARRFGSALAPGDPLNRLSYKTRRGVSGGWADELSLEDQEYAAELLHTYRYESRCAAAGIASPFSGPAVRRSS